MESIDGPVGLTMPEAPGVDAIVLPREISDEVGLYDDSTVTVVKELRSLGASSDYLHEPELRTWIGENAVPAVVLELLIGITANAGWDALFALLRRRGKEQVKIEAGRLIEKPDEKRWEWVRAEGEGEAVATALAAWRGEAEEAVENGEEH